MISGLLGGFGKWSRLTGSSDDDWIDRLNHIWTVVMLSLFAVIVSSGQYVGDPIQCWCPAEFSGSRVSYTKSVCWISNTYYIPDENELPRDGKTRQDAEITYYQWVPLIFLIQALMFKLPNIAWHMLNGYSGISLEKITTMAEDTMLASPEKRNEKIMYIAKYMNRWIETHRDWHYNFFVRMRQKFSNILCFCIGKRDGTYLTGFYLFVKVLYCVNVVGQFFLLNEFLSMNYNVFGIDVINFLLANGEWKASPRFPRVTLCDLQIRQLNNLQTFTVQCVLPINLFNEKLFIFLWFWLLFVTVLTFINFSTWVYYIVFSENKIRYVRKYLTILGQLETGFDKKVSRKFAAEYLRGDGVFVLRVVGKNSSDMVLTDLVQHLWKVFKEEHCKLPKKDDRVVSDHEPTEKDTMNGDVIHTKENNYNV
ncbi:innexin unc-9-like [Pecten maximus]|uniref:innexin unc-9-like n=1 Tax=Pecten maximus TaxID=6579 RepID=UPI001457F7F2|nr:innexin unc-9-like [Pecten maximus]XP_033728698.1 innexin unc-9-like [Pecten maximus]